mgnify:CR=1 FL=1
MNAEKDDLEIDNLPNRLTIFRMLLIPLVVGSLFIAGQDFVWAIQIKTNLGWFAGWIFTIASITDFFDGYIARKKNIVTVFGSFLDHIDEKFLVVCFLIMLIYFGRVHALIVIILVLRELYITYLRLLAHSEGISVPVNSMGKWKTVIQMIATPMLMIYETWWIIPFDLLGTVLIYLASAISIASATIYSLGVVVKLKEVRKQKRLLRKQKKQEQKNQEKI